MKKDWVDCPSLFPVLNSANHEYIHFLSLAHDKNQTGCQDFPLPQTLQVECIFKLSIGTGFSHKQCNDSSSKKKNPPHLLVTIRVTIHWKPNVIRIAGADDSKNASYILSLWGRRELFLDGEYFHNILLLSSNKDLRQTNKKSNCVEWLR